MMTLAKLNMELAAAPQTLCGLIVIVIVIVIVRDSKQILLDHLKAAGLDPSILDESNAGDNQDLEKDEVLHRPHLENFDT